MPHIASQVVGELPCPSQALLEVARLGPKGPDFHAAAFDRMPALGMIEVGAMPQPRAVPATLRIVAFNAERLAFPDAVASILNREEIDIALLCEVDLGMARSGNSHTARRLSQTLGMGYIFGPEFVELDLGDRDEMRRCEGQQNACGLHGNAILSRFSLEEAHLIRLECDGLWFGGMEGAQRRIGGRVALAARVAGPKPLWVVSTHLESKTDPAHRQQLVSTLLRSLDSLIGDAPCVIGGDFNTKALPRQEGTQEQVLATPEAQEPLFADLRAAGFSWQASNIAKPTQRDGPWKRHDRPFGKLDWIFTRGLVATDPAVIPAVDGKGSPVSDHDMMTAKVSSE